MSSPKPAIGAATAVTTTAATKSLFVFIDECPFWIPINVAALAARLS